MATDGIAGIFIETRNYGATTAFWRSLGFESVFETDHGSGQLMHPAGGPYLFVAEQHDRELATHPIVNVADAITFTKEFGNNLAAPFTPQHWDVVEAFVHDPDGRAISLQAPLPEGVSAADAHQHHAEKYGTANFGSEPGL